MSIKKTEWLWHLTPAQRMHFFIELNHAMTIAMRVICHSDDSEAIERIDALNEAHHVVAGYLIRIYSGAEDHRWLGLSVNGIFKPEDPILRQQLDQSWLVAEEIVKQNL